MTIHETKEITLAINYKGTAFETPCSLEYRDGDDMAVGEFDYKLGPIPNTIPPNDQDLINEDIDTLLFAVCGRGLHKVIEGSTLDININQE